MGDLKMVPTAQQQEEQHRAFLDLNGLAADKNPDEKRAERKVFFTSLAEAAEAMMTMKRGNFFLQIPNSGKVE